MDSRQSSQAPYARNTTSPYSRAPFASPNQAPFPPPASQSTPVYEHQRRPSDPPYYPSQRPYGQESGPPAGQTHSRHQSASSIGHRIMPPPSSPQQHPQSGYPQPSITRGPPPSLAPPTSFSSTGRDLPSLSSIVRPGSTGSAMSISSMLGGPPPSTTPTPQYAPPPISSTGSGGYSNSLQASPRQTPASVGEYPSRRPLTPEYARAHEQQGMREGRASSAGSPQGPRTAYGSTPEAGRYGASQYTGRASHSSAPLEERRDSLNRGGSARPQPTHRLSDPPRLDSGQIPASRTSGSPRRPSGSPLLTQRLPERYEREPSYARPYSYDNAGHGHDRRQEEEALLRERDMRERELRERDLREREYREREARERGRPGVGGPEISPPAPNGHYGSPLAQHQQPLYNRPPEARDPGWRPGYEQPQAGHDYQRQGNYAANGYPHDYRYPSSGPQGGHGPGEQHPPDREPPHHGQHPYAQGQQQYAAHESPRGHSVEAANQQNQRGGLLAVHEINRKGRTSPLPQAVQGAQGQLHGPAGEPGIKSEFGRMFAGIGSGVGREMAQPSPSASGTPFPPGRRDELEGTPTLEADGGQRLVRTASSRSAKRRKPKEEETKADEESANDRSTPARGSKRAKPHHHHYPAGVHHHHHHHHHTRPEGEEVTSPQDVAPAAHHHHVPRHHHHHHAAPSKTSSTASQPTNIIVPKPKQVVRSHAVLTSVSHLPRKHLGYATYGHTVKVNEKLPPGRGDRGFMSIPRPLPRFSDNENCTFTVRVPRIYLSNTSREEITSTRPVWGTDIYTDDSDVIGACIHSGWIRGEWPEDIDVSLLDLVVEAPEGTKPQEIKEGKDVILNEPPPTGPIAPPENMDLNITVLILPALERYSSTTRWGMRSREWSNTHDGISFMIHSIRFVEGEDTWKPVRGQGRRMRMDLALKDEELEEERAWGPMFDNGSGTDAPYGTAVVKESFVRGSADTPKYGDEFTGLGMKSWWVKPAKAVVKETDVAPVEEVKMSDS